MRTPLIKWKKNFLRLWQDLIYGNLIKYKLVCVPQRRKLPRPSWFASSCADAWHELTRLEILLYACESGDFLGGLGKARYRKREGAKTLKPGGSAKETMCVELLFTT